jgi:hypothetical protein
MFGLNIFVLLKTQIYVGTILGTFLSTEVRWPLPHPPPPPFQYKRNINYCEVLFTQPLRYHLPSLLRRLKGASFNDEFGLTLSHSLCSEYGGKEKQVPPSKLKTNSVQDVLAQSVQ